MNNDFYSAFIKNSSTVCQKILIYWRILNVFFFSVEKILQHFRANLTCLGSNAVKWRKQLFQLKFTSIIFISLNGQICLILRHSGWKSWNKYKDATGGNPFREVANFVINLLTLPDSNADVEHLFRSMGISNSKVNYLWLNQNYL